MEKSQSQQRYLPHELNTRYYAVKFYRSGHSIKAVCRRYKVSKASLMRWNKQFDGTKQSLVDKSHVPHTKHPNAHTDQELKWIKDYLRRNPKISGYALYGKLCHDKNYTRSITALYNILKRLGYMKPTSKKKSVYKPKKYNTPTMLGIKWQLDVKEIPKNCYKGDKHKGDFFQYTAIDEASRERFIHPYLEKTAKSSVDFIKRAIRYFKYKPQIVQTDNGAEFVQTNPSEEKIHSFDEFCIEHNIEHKTIRPRTPRHNGKAERSHGKDQKFFYNNLKFYTFDGLKIRMKAYMRKSNNTPMRILDWKTPQDKRTELLKK